MPASREQLERDHAADPDPQMTADDEAVDQAERAAEDAEAKAGGDAQ